MKALSRWRSASMMQQYVPQVAILVLFAVVALLVSFQMQKQKTTSGEVALFACLIIAFVAALGGFICANNARNELTHTKKELSVAQAQVKEWHAGTGERTWELMHKDFKTRRRNNFNGPNDVTPYDVAIILDHVIHPDWPIEPPIR